MTIKPLLPMALLLATYAASAQSAPTTQTAQKHDLTKNCHYSFQTEKSFVSLPENEPCTLNLAASDTFFASYITSSPDALKGDGVFGNFQLNGGKPALTIRSYTDEARGVWQRLITTKQMNLPSPSKHDYAAVSTIVVAYGKQRTGSNTLEAVEETYDCWNSISYSKRTAVIASLCDRRSAVSATDASWQAKLIRSIKAE